MSDDKLPSPRRDSILLGLSLFMLAITTIALSVALSYFARQVQYAQTNRSALCTFKAQLASSIHNSEFYVAQHPGVLKKLGISTAYYNRQLLQQQLELQSLAGLGCH